MVLQPLFGYVRKYDHAVAYGINICVDIRRKRRIPGLNPFFNLAKGGACSGYPVN